MRTLQLILIGILLTAMQSALAEVDLTCQSNCMNKSYMIDFCTEKCSYGRPSSQQQSGGYQPSGALGALQAGEREANNQTKQQLEMIKQMLEIEKMKRELQNQHPTYTTTPLRSCDYSVDCPGDLVCNRFNRCTDPKIENWEGERIAR